jgi:hypothetical protein
LFVQNPQSPALAFGRFRNFASPSFHLPPPATFGHLPGIRDFASPPVPVPPHLQRNTRRKLFITIRNFASPSFRLPYNHPIRTPPGHPRFCVTAHLVPIKHTAEAHHHHPRFCVTRFGANNPCNTKYTSSTAARLENVRLASVRFNDSGSGP